MKKLCSVLLSCLIAIVPVTGNVLAEDTADNENNNMDPATVGETVEGDHYDRPRELYGSGKCGPAVTYTVRDNVLELSGSGITYSYSFGQSPFSYASNINYVVIDEGITSVGRALFYEMDNLYEVYLPSTLDTINSSAFSYDINLQTIGMYPGIQTVESHAVIDCSNMKSVYWYGDAIFLDEFYIDDYNDILANATYYVNYGLENVNGQFLYYDHENDVVDYDYYGFTKYDGAYFLVAHGSVATYISGLAQDPLYTDAWYFLADGRVVNYTGLALYDGAWFYVENGRLAVEYSGEVYYDGSWFYVDHGMLR